MTFDLQEVGWKTGQGTDVGSEASSHQLRITTLVKPFFLYTVYILCLVWSSWYVAYIEHNGSEFASMYDKKKNK